MTGNDPKLILTISALDPERLIIVWNSRPWYSLNKRLFNHSNDQTPNTTGNRHGLRSISC